MDVVIPALIPSCTALVLIEFQREWLDSEGRLNKLIHDRQLEGAVRAGREILQLSRRIGLTIFHVGLNFTEGHPELGKTDLGLRAAIPRVSTFVGRGAEFAPAFAPAPGEFVVSGRLGASGFAGSNLDSLLRNRGITTLLIAGFALHVCVESTMRQAHDLGYRVLLLEDACAAFTAAQRRHVLDEIVHHFGAALNVATVKRLLMRDEAAPMQKTQ